MSPSIIPDPRLPVLNQCQVHFIFKAVQTKDVVKDHDATY